jgi:hypothetical protein
LGPIHAALTLLADKELQTLVFDEVVVCLGKDAPVELSSWCSSCVYAVTHTIYVLGSYTHGVYACDHLHAVFDAVYLLLVKLADSFGRMHPSRWAVHAECAIEVAIALHLLSVGPDAVRNERFAVPPSCAAARKYVYAYPSTGALSTLASSRRDVATPHRRKNAVVGHITRYMYGEIHTRMVVVHALAVFARYDQELCVPETTQIEFQSGGHYQGHKIHSEDIEMVMNHMRGCPKDLKLTAHTIAMALPYHGPLCPRSRKSAITHVLAYLCDERELLIREQGATRFVPFTYYMP